MPYTLLLLQVEFFFFFFFLPWCEFFIWVLHFACSNVARIFSGLKFGDFFTIEKNAKLIQLGIQTLNQHNPLYT